MIINRVMCVNLNFAIQLQTAILNASSGVVQSLANQANIPASLLSSALINANMAATLSATGGVMNPGIRYGIVQCIAIRTYNLLRCNYRILQSVHCSVGSLILSQL